jgi:hypothetical protein
MKKWVATMVAYSCVFLGSVAQEWAPLEEGFTGPPSELFNDTDTSLIVMGGFSGTANGMFADGIVRWNGESYSTLTGAPAGESWSNSASNMVRYLGDLYFHCGGGIGQLYVEGFPVTRGLCKYDGDEVTNPITQAYNGAYNPLTIYRGQIALGSYRMEQGQAMVYFWDGNELDSISATGFQATHLGAFFASDMLEHDDKLIFGGNLHFAKGGVHEIVSWCPEEGFDDMNHGVRGFAAHVQALEVYNGELIVCGYFFSAEGNPTDFIMRWDGENFLPMGIIGANNRVDALMAYGGYLYAGGHFTQMDAIDCRIARWNGESWEAFNTSNSATPGGFNGGIRDFEIFQGELHICGGFDVIDEVEVNGVAKYTGPLALTNFTIFSNGFDDAADIELTPDQLVLSNLDAEHSWLLEMANSEKELVYSEWRMSVEEPWVIATSGFEPGEYYVSLASAEGHYTTKIQLLP